MVVKLHLIVDICYKFYAGGLITTTTTLNENSSTTNTSKTDMTISL